MSTEELILIATVVATVLLAWITGIAALVTFYQIDKNHQKTIVKIATLGTAVVVNRARAKRAHKKHHGQHDGTHVASVRSVG